MLIYLGQPYTDANPKIQEARYEAAREFVATQVSVRQSLVLYSPIVHWHTIAQDFSLPEDADFWWSQNKIMLQKADMLWVLNLQGWKQSKGLRQEIEYAFFRGIPIEHKKV